MLHVHTHTHHTYVLLSIAEPPKITAHPQELKDFVPNKSVSLAIQATGTEPLRYHWEIKPGNGSRGWQSCNLEGFQGRNSPFPMCRSPTKGCIVGNIVRNQTSEPG